MSQSETPKPPRGTRAAGRRFWQAVVDAYDLTDGELALLAQVTGTLDVIADLEAAAADQPTVIDGPHGQKVSPVLAELRQQRLALARLLSALRLPTSPAELDDLTRPQRRSGVRGTYKLGLAK